jgi:putative two-component system response regulator
MRSNTVLVVDDEKSNLNFIVNNLEKLYSIKVAPNGEVALKILDKFEIDVVLLDIEMPKLNGYETIKAMREIEKLRDIPVIFLTAKSDAKSITWSKRLYNKTI